MVICGRTEPEQLPEARGTRAVFVAADVRQVEDIDRVIAAARERWGRLDVLVNNAGGSPHTEAATASPRFSEAIIRLNLIAPLNCAQRANAVMQTQADGGTIINIASVSGIRPSPGTAAYGAAKAGLLNLTESLAVEWAPKVRVNAITAGMIRTEQSHLHYGDEAGSRGGGGDGAARPPGRAGGHRRRVPVPRLAAGPLRQRHQHRGPRRRRTAGVSRGIYRGGEGGGQSPSIRRLSPFRTPRGGAEERDFTPPSGEC